MGRVHSGMRMETATMGSLRETNPMDTVSTRAQMAPYMKVYGSMTYSMDRDRQDGQMGPSIRASTTKVVVTA